MQLYSLNRFCALRRSSLVAFLAAFALAAPSLRAQTPPPPKTTPAVGTIRSISGDSLTLATDSGTELKVQIPSDVKVLQVPPGSKDLRQANAIPLSNLQTGDRILVRGKPGADPSSFTAATIIAMKKADIAVKLEKDREEWQRHGIGGLVDSVDPAQNAIMLKTLTATGAKDVTVHVGKTTILRRYAPGSVNFDEATVAPITDIKPGDQLRARGSRSADGAEFTADEVVSGSFRNIAGIVVSVNGASGTLTVDDLVTKKPLQLKVSAESQMRKLPQPVAQRIAIQLKGNGPPPNGSAPPANQPGGTPPPNAGEAPGANSGNTGMTGAPRNGNGSGDLQQMLSHLPAAPLSDFQKGDAVMVVATSGTEDGAPTVITMLGGVEPILQASSKEQAASILSPWSLNQGGAEPGTP